MRPIRYVVLWTCYTRAVQAIPAQLIPPSLAGLLVRKAAVTVVVKGATDSDAVCQWVTKPWWTEYKETREIARVTSKPGSVFLREPTQYPNEAKTTPEVPVESFMGEVFVPSDSGWHTGRWGCYFGCQDIQKTLEWVMAAVLEYDAKVVKSIKHVRARWTYGFECPTGMISKIVIRPTRREYDTSAEITQAITLLKDFTADKPKPPMDNLHLYGSIGPGVAACTCEIASEIEELRAWEEHRKAKQKRKREGAESLESARQVRTRHYVKARARKGSRGKNPEGSTSGSAGLGPSSGNEGDPDYLWPEIPDPAIPEPVISEPVSEPVIPDPDIPEPAIPAGGDPDYLWPEIGEPEPENNPYDPIYGDILTEDLPMPSTITCHDYDYPRMGIPTLPGVPDIPIPRSPNHEEDYAMFLQAFIDDYAEYEAANGGFGVASPKGHF